MCSRRAAPSLPSRPAWPSASPRHPLAARRPRCSHMDGASPLSRCAHAMTNRSDQKEASATARPPARLHRCSTSRLHATVIRVAPQTDRLSPRATTERRRCEPCMHLPTTSRQSPSRSPLVSHEFIEPTLTITKDRHRISRDLARLSHASVSLPTAPRHQPKQRGSGTRLAESATHAHSNMSIPNV